MTTFLRRASLIASCLGTGLVALVVHPQALDWMRGRSVDEIYNAREAAVCAIEQLGQRLRANGAADAWCVPGSSTRSVRSALVQQCCVRLAGADSGIRSVSGTVNGPLLEALARRAGCIDAECIELFRRGGNLVGKLTM